MSYKSTYDGYDCFYYDDGEEVCHDRVVVDPNKMIKVGEESFPCDLPSKYGEKPSSLELISCRNDASRDLINLYFVFFML